MQYSPGVNPAGTSTSVEPVLVTRRERFAMTLCRPKVALVGSWHSETSTVGTSPWLLQLTSCVEPTGQTCCCTATAEISGTGLMRLLAASGEESLDRLREGVGGADMLWLADERVEVNHQTTCFCIQYQANQRTYALDEIIMAPMKRLFD